VINNKLQGSLATHLAYGGVVNNQIKNGFLLSLSVKKIKIGEYLAKLPARGGCIVHFVRLATTPLKDEESVCCCLSVR